jgi:hypothetical protein
MHLLLHIFRLQYSFKRICAAIGNISTIQCSLYCKLVAKYSAHLPVYAMWTMDPDIYNAFKAPYIQTSIFIWTSLRCYCTYHDNSMRVILQTWCQIQSTCYGLRYVNCGPGHIPCIYSSAYSILNIRLNVSSLLLEICRYLHACYTANFVPNTEPNLRFALCDLWSRTYTMHLQLHIFRLQNSFERICAAILHITTIQCALYCKLVAKYSAHPPVYAMWTVVRTIYKVFTAPHIQTSMFIWTYLRCYWRYLDNSIVVILQTWCQIQRTSSGLSYVNYGRGHIQCIYSSIYSDFNIHLNVSALQFYISRQFSARYTANMLPNTAHILQFMLCELWSWLYTKYLQLRIFRLQCSSERICAAIGDISTIQCSLYCKLGAKYSAHPPVYAMWTMDSDIYNAFTAPYIQTSIFIWTYLRCYCTYHDNSMRVILQTCCQIQRTSSSLCYVICAPGHIQSTYSSAYLGLNIHLYAAPLLLEVSRQFNARYTAFLVPNTAHILRFTLCELWSRTYTMHLQLRIFRLQYSFERICAAIVHITTIQCSLYSKLVAKCNAHPPVYAMWTVVPAIYKVLTAPHI